MSYQHKEIEKKWQKIWDEKKPYKAELDQSKPKYYILDMFPYTSGSGLHVGHAVGYTATDILARYKRQCGFNVLHPMGWDSFGLPAEQHAIRTGTHPAETTQKNIDNFRKQLKRVGFSYDWDREFATSDPKYYKWTQWIFTKLYETGLAYEANMPVNYCPALGTVLANEEVEGGKSREGGHPVERRQLKQWMLKITAYAERLLKDLDDLNWPDYLKRLQRNWIGKSEGVKVHFPVENQKEELTVFTTRADTLFGVTFMVIAPEHPFVEALTTEVHREDVRKYQKSASLKSDLDRTDLAKGKSGVFTGSYAINPANNKKIPIWISDYVLMGYGTGAIMAVPSDDERDLEFANQYKLEVIPVYNEDGLCINSANSEISLNGMRVDEAKESIDKWLDQKGFGERTINYKLRDWLFSRQRYWGEPVPILHLEDGTKRVLSLDELPLCPPDVSDYKPVGAGESPLAKVTEWVQITDPKTGQSATRETNTMPQWAGSCWYYLRFCDPHNENAPWDKEKEKYWMPVDLYVGGVEHAVLHLLYARFWHKVLYDGGYVSTKEPFSSMCNQGLVVAKSFKDSSNNYVQADTVIKKDGKYFHPETGEELTAQVEKMSKSKLNGVTPDDIIEEFGADSLRLYEMFMGPLDKEKLWNTDAVSGCRRFLKRFYEIAVSDKVSTEESQEALKLGHKLVHSVKTDIESMQFNTAIAKMMEFVNDFTKLPSYPKSVIRMCTQALYPFAPHIAEEIWEILDSKECLTTHPFPKADPKYLTEESVTYVVQINGKVRGRFEFPKDQSEEKILSVAKQDPRIQKFLDEKEIRRVIFVPNKVLNLVVG
ncbi:MAG: leucine--tRNA ligase [Waddliaceae bacterium]